MALTRLIYFSQRTDERPETIGEILRDSRRNNARDGISGALLVDGRYFLQLLEGPRSRVSQCLARIMRDPRHREIGLIAAAEVGLRLFAEESLAALDLRSVRQALLDPLRRDGKLHPPLFDQVAVEQVFRALSRDSSAWDAALWGRAD